MFFRSKPKQQGWHRRPLARYPAAWAGWLRDYARFHGVAWDAPYVAGGAPALERGLAELLAGTRWRGYTWHCFRRGGAGASWGRKPNLPYFKWWGGWTDTPTAMRYAAAFKAPEVLVPLQLPSPSSESVGSGAEESTNCIALWGGGMFGADKPEENPGCVGVVHLPPPPGDRQADTVDPLLRVAVVGMLYPTQLKTRIPAPRTALTAAPRAAPASRSSSRPQGGFMEAHSRPSGLGRGGGGGARPRKRRRPGAQGSGRQCQTTRTTKRVVPVGVPRLEQREGAPGEPVGVAGQSPGQPPTLQRCFVRPEQGEA